MSRIEQIIEEIEEYVDSCKFQPLSSTKIVVNKEELEELDKAAPAGAAEQPKKKKSFLGRLFGK